MLILFENSTVRIYCLLCNHTPTSFQKRSWSIHNVSCKNNLKKYKKEGSLDFSFFHSFFSFCSTGNWIQGLMYAKKALYHLRYTSEFFCFYFYFWDRVMLTLPGLVSNSWSSHHCLPNSWDYKHTPLTTLNFTELFFTIVKTMKN
jgi:hypothetical protein